MTTRKRPSGSGGPASTSDRYLVIGAGPAGLALAAAFRRRSISFDLVDRHHAIGGLWDRENPGTPLYDSAHFISSRTMSAFAGFPMPARYPDYPGHRLILDYLREFAAHHDVHEHFTGGRAVTSARPEPSGGWAVTFSDGRSHRYAGLAVATGRQWTPRRPEWPGAFDGELIHARDYDGPGRLRGRRVLVVGGGNSGVDIACDAATAAVETRLSLRRGYHVIPKYVLGRPADVFAAQSPPLPAWLRQAVMRRLLRLLAGRPEDYGLPAPDHRIFESHPILNDRILHHLGHGDVTAVPDVVALEGPEIRFTDDSTWRPDLVIQATGYRVDFPFLPPGLVGAGAGTPDLYLHVLDRRRPDLFFLGLFETDAGAFPLLSRQADLVASAVLTHRVGGPAARLLAVRKQLRPNLSGGVRHLDSPRHRAYADQRVYRRELERAHRELEALRAGGDPSRWRDH
ncbi:flavin-containing monooxygenase [Actinoalloteichus caeruleus]|uniref:flavin-containing monooxygenase n=1 Tax=Actinoalloteichus cyanogriseus TaxID=2893586 RepID=UPI003BB86210